MNRSERTSAIAALLVAMVPILAYASLWAFPVAGGEAWGAVRVAASAAIVGVIGLAAWWIAKLGRGKGGRR